MPLNEWHDRSFLIELKPRAEFANLFVDCPPSQKAGHDENSSPTQELVKLGEHLLEVDGADSDENCTRLRSRSSSVESANNATKELGGDQQQQQQHLHHHRFVADIADLCLFPNSVCGLTWADHRRLLMCKVHAEPEGLPLVPKTFRRLARDIRGEVTLDHYVEDARSNTSVLGIVCSGCKYSLFSGSCDMMALPEDDWLETSPGMEYFCKNECRGHRHGEDDSQQGNTHPLENGDRSRWLPSAGGGQQKGQPKVVIGHSFVLVSADSVAGTVDRETPVTANIVGSRQQQDRSVSCSRCNSQLGRSSRSDPNVLELYNTAVNCHTDLESPTFLSLRYGSFERYYAWLLMSQCDSQSSLKLVVRSMDKRPHLLIWLLESYVILTNGDLKETSDDGDEEEQSSDHKPGEDGTAAAQPPLNGHCHQHEVTHSFPALKMLYKVFDAESAATAVFRLRVGNSWRIDVSVVGVDINDWQWQHFVLCQLAPRDDVSKVVGPQSPQSQQSPTT